MVLADVTSRQPGQRTLPDHSGQRGQRKPAASSSRAGCAQCPRPRLRRPWALIFVVLGVLLLVKRASAMSIRKDEIHQQLSAPPILRQKLCRPGFYMEEASGGCAPCTDGIDYTNHSNTLPSCLPCTTCRSGEEEKNRCTSTKDTECQCKPGTFLGEDAPEFCQKCSTGCPDGKVMVMDCTPLSNIKCVDQESGTLWLVNKLIIGLGVPAAAALIGYITYHCCFKGAFGECCHKVKKLTEDNTQSQDEASRQPTETSSTEEEMPAGSTEPASHH